jgi:hypothetical protein
MAGSVKRKKRPTPLDRLRTEMLVRGVTEEQMIAELDNIVHDMKSEEASSLNNEGIDTQLEYVGLAAAMTALENLAANAKEA